MNMGDLSTFLVFSSISLVFFIFGFFISLGLFLGILFFKVALVNQIAFLISFSGGHYWYRKATDFRMLILYPATLQGQSLRVFLLNLLGFSMCRIIYADRDNLTSSFCCVVVCFFCSAGDWASCLPGKHCTTESYPQTNFLLFHLYACYFFLLPNCSG